MSGDIPLLHQCKKAASTKDWVQIESERDVTSEGRLGMYYRRGKGE